MSETEQRRPTMVRRGRLRTLHGWVAIVAALLVTGCTADVGPGMQPTPAGSPSVAPGSSPDASSPDAPGGSATPEPSPRTRCFGRRPTIVGTMGDDTLEGTSRRDVVVALGGDDRVTGLRMEDVLCASAGADTVAHVDGYGVRLDLGGGDDRLSEVTLYAVLDAGPGDDELTLSARWGHELRAELGPGDDRLRAVRQPRRRPDASSVCLSFSSARRPVSVDLARGVARGQGRDRFSNVRCVSGGASLTRVRGSAADDYVQAWRGPLVVRAGAGNDYVNGGRHDDRVRLGAGDDHVNGGPSPNRLHGGPGRDLLIGDIGNDTLDGGPGHDRGFGQEDGLVDVLISLEQPTTC